MARKPAPKSKKVAAKRKKSRSWRSDSKRRRNSTKLKKSIVKYLSAAFLFIASISTLFAYVSYKKLTSPYVSASSSTSFDTTNEDLYTVAFIGVDSVDASFITVEQLNYLVFDKRNKKIINYEIPVSHEVDVPGRYGKEPLEKILGLGMSVNNDSFDSGVLVTTDAVAKMFAFPVHRYVVASGETSEKLEDMLSGDMSSVTFDLLSFSNLEHSLKTNMNFQELKGSHEFVKKLPADRLIRIEFDQSYLDDTSTVDDLLRDLTFDSKVAHEEMSVSVLNGTKIIGAAGFGSRIMTNVGARVVSVSNASEEYENTLIIAKDLDSETVKAAKSFFGSSELVLASESTYKEKEIERSDVTIIIGLDIAKSL